MERRYFLISIIAACALGGISGRTFGGDGSKKPNVVVIYSDDQGWGDVGYHGYDDVRTPNIDALARNGVWFSQGYVSSSICMPSRVGVLTGVYQQRLGMDTNSVKGGIPTSQPMVFEMLKREGYQTAAIGKWHVGGEGEEYSPNRRGVDFFYGSLWGSHDYHKSSADPADLKKWDSPIMRNTTIEPPIQDSNGYLTEMLTKETVSFIERADDDKPFFIYLAHYAVHAPWQVPQSYIDRVQNLKANDERKFFAAMTLAMDDGVGAVMDALKRKGVEKDTLVIFISDNGTPNIQGIPETFKQRGETTMSNPGPFRGFKGDVYEGGTRVPFIACWPGVLPAGKKYEHPVLNLDVVPTVMSLVGVSKPYKGLDFDGVDLLPYLTGKKSADEKPHDVMYWRRQENYAIRKGDWKLCFNPHSGAQSSRTIQLFNIADDPGEWKDLVDEKPEIAQQLQDTFDAWDSRLIPSQSGLKFSNRNFGYADGERVNVAEFNARPLLANGGFEDVASVKGNAGEPLPDLWHLWYSPEGPAVSAGLTDKKKRSGKNSLFLKCRKGDPRYGFVQQVSVEEGQMYRFSAYLLNGSEEEALTGKSHGTLSLEWKNFYGQSVGHLVSDSWGADLSDSKWQRFEVEQKAPPGAKFCNCVIAMLSSDGKVNEVFYIDDCEFQDLGSDPTKSKYSSTLTTK